MAVYTDVAAEDLARFLAGYDVGELLSYKGIAEGVENSNFLVHTSTGNFILTLYERRVAERDLPFFLSLMEHLASRGITCPQPVKTRTGKMLGKLAGRPAAMVTFLDGLWIRRPTAAHCAALGRGAGAAASRRRRFFHAPRQRAVGRRLAGALRRLPRARPQGGAQSRNAGRGRARRARTRLAARPAARRHPRRSVSRQCVFPRRQAVRADRFLLRLHRHARLRRRHLPQRLVLRDRSFLQRHQGPRAARRAIAKTRPLSQEEWEKLPLLARGAALRFLLTRLVDWLDRAARRWCGRRIRANMREASLPPEGQKRARLRIVPSRERRELAARRPSTPTAPARAIRAPAAGARS